MILVNLSGHWGDVLLDWRTFPDPLKHELLHVLVQPLVDVVDVIQARTFQRKENRKLFSQLSDISVINNLVHLGFSSNITLDMVTSY